MKISSCKNFEAKEGMGVYSRWAYFREGTVNTFAAIICKERTLVETVQKSEKFE